MTTGFARKDPGLAMVLTFSTIIHVAIFVALSFSHFGSSTPSSDQVYYVDMVSLPVASPQAGSPNATDTAPPPPAPPSKSPEMKLPAPAVKQAPAKNAAMSKQAKTAPATDASSSEFEERLARLKSNAESKHQAAALEALRKKVSGSGTGASGVSKGTGREAGVDYASYIQAQLYKAFNWPQTPSGKKPEVLVRLNINRSGKLTEYRFEKSTGDRAFENAVARAIAKAERTFRPPPNNENFSQSYIFKPDSVGKK